MLELKLSNLQGKGQVAAALSAVEQNPSSAPVTSLLDDAFANPKGIAIGITGPPGAGKSTLINTLISEWRGTGLSVAVLAVDPSSKATKGALLGDRVRMRTDPEDRGVFVRSLAARDRLGGLADIAYPATVLLRALYDRVIVESVGVGQSETDIDSVSDTVVLCVQPGSGDSLQFMKAGIVEIPDIAIVTKADMGAIATRALADLKGALGLAHRESNAWEPRCLAVSAASSSGLGPLLDAIGEHEIWLNSSGRLEAKRKAQATHWLQSEIVTNFGRNGLKAAEKALLSFSGVMPFSLAQQVLSQLQVINRSPLA